ncbi:MAG: hypothetical protein JNM70_18660 [Anaerolineae bacterium]|nr:hypothetical protein [Anaerolineae bacterium]
MPAKDRYHDTVKRALRKNGWQITREQVRVTFEDKNLWIDIQAEHPDQERIVLIEVKELEKVSSPVEALACAIGKYLVYRMGLRNTNSDSPLYLAITSAAYDGVINTSLGQQAVAEFGILLLVFDPVQEVVQRWIP